MGKKLRTYADWAVREAMIDYVFYSNMYKRMVTSMFKWGGLPETVSARFIELTLYNYGMCAIYMDKGGFLVAGEVRAIDAKNDYEEPTAIRVGKGFLSRKLKAGEFAVVRNDMLGNPSTLAAKHYAKRLEGIDKTMAVNLEQLKQPSLVCVPEGQLLTAKQLWKQKESGDPVIFLEQEAFENINVAGFDLKVQNHMQQLYDSKHEEINESMTYFGVNNVNVVKRERLTSGETQQNDEQIYHNAMSMLIPRQKGCEDANKLFGINIRVEIDRPDVETVEEKGNPNKGKGGEGDGK